MNRFRALLNKIPNPFLRYGLLAVVSLFLVGILFFLSIYFGAWGKLPSKKELSNFEYQRASEVYTADSVLIGKYYLFDRQPIPYENFPPHLLDALIAIEDERFYEHSGVDYPSLFRVAFKTILMQDESSGGGSTLTQQLAKNLYPRKDRAKANLAINKIKEMIIASRLEDLYSKKEILTHYLNTVSFGDNTYGIESASLRFFNKRTLELTIEEAAVLVGMLKATYGYNPRVFPENSLRRRNLVLQSMVNNKFLEEGQKDSLSNVPIKLNYRKFNYTDGLAPYFREEVRKQLLKWSNTEKEKGNAYNIYTSGLKIYTTLDYKMQQLAEKVMKTHMASLQKSFERSYAKNAPWQTDKKIIEKAVRNSPHYKKLIQNGLDPQQAMDSLRQKRTMTLADWSGEKTVQASPIDSIKHYMKFLNTGSLAIDAQTGAVKTWIGGVDFKNFKFDHVAQSKRQVGSTFKPIVYTAALEVGIPACTYFSASEVEYKNLKGWSPSNSGEKDETYLNYSMEEALSNSVNTVAVKVLEATGIENVLIQAKNMGVFSSLPEQPSLALGTGEIYVNELAGVYASYVNDGRAVLPYLIETITDQKDSVLTRFEPKRARERAFSSTTRELMIQMMKATVDKGTAKRIRTTYGLNNDIAGKTGTTQNNKDAWFVALTPKLVHVTWVGLDNHEIGFRSTSLGQGANAALPLFALWYKELNRAKEFNSITKARFKRPSKTVLDELNCPPVKRDGFFKRLFKNPNKKRRKRFNTR
ncbi:penicillin-binding protein [Flavobacteriaceae bacterium TP-CH-4]|uniref:Penicillin-binding protein n=1 Tax=Pelagihabitans pacificus TaxID=2696054 RepID=A0A967EFF2_9FLAO|nr:transglycosylase domain-containing protein [Pelagihabitans pacificus]NHF61353.1 penicillin-binding protein [Pelagihabitans pacificus]